MVKRLTILFDRLRWEEKQLYNAARRLGVSVKLVDCKSLLFDCQDTRELLESVEGVVLQRCVSYFRGLYWTAVLESLGVKVVNRFQTSLICGNKLLTTLKLTTHNIPTPRTFATFDVGRAMEAMEKLGYLAVMKPVVGSWGRLVTPIRDRYMAESFLELFNQIEDPVNKVFYIQEMVQRPPRDIRSVVVGDRVVACVYRHAAPNEWRTNVARGGTTSPCKVTPNLRRVLIDTAKAVGGGVLGIDVMEHNGKFLVHEVNSTVEFRGAQESTKGDIATAIIKYVAEQDE